MDYSRRNVLKMGVSAAATWAMGSKLLAADAGKKIPVGLQLYSVREACQKDLAGTLEAIAKMGYKGVEFAGYYGHDAKAVRKMLDNTGLVCCGTHTGLDQLQGNKFKPTVELHQTLGCKFINVPYIPEERFSTVEKCKQLGQEFSALAEKLKADGMRVGYHAHGGDFKKIGDETYWDLFFANTSKDVNMQLDVGNCLDGGGDPYAILKKFPGRAMTIHIKPHGNNNATIGQDQLRWNEIFELIEKPGKTEWYIVEYEVDAAKTDGIKACIEGLRKMGKC